MTCFIIRGINVFPSQIEACCWIWAWTQLPHDRGPEEQPGHLEVQVEMNESMFSDTVRSLERWSAPLPDALHSTLNIAAHHPLLEPKSIERSEGKAKRVIDRRKL